MMGIFNIVKMSVLLKVIHIFTAIPISFLTAFYLFIYLFIQQLEKPILKIIWNCKGF